ncbi:hypothetical protein [Pinibacter aurantiacus]|uniref:Uncharacterized protein n=1 Tax=Pinibacter aurantiacus TaxID=2851599 RepID=A0A9E2S9U8_9BACT|nr:hypothetical protein [Pinibacter aurantiacus]MBV4357324.1 hypothetical protein [Pinibacter aurantiacus]
MSKCFENGRKLFAKRYLNNFGIAANMLFSKYNNIIYHKAGIRLTYTANKFGNYQRYHGK